MTEPINVKQVVREIEDEVRRRRQSGELPMELERDLDMIFAQYAPVGAVQGDFDQVVARVEKVAFIDVAVPTGSNQPGVSYVKRGLKKGMAWYLNYVAQQVSAFAHASTRALRILGERVDRIEAGRSDGPGAALAADVLAASPPVDLSAFIPSIEQILGDLPGRIVHADAGAGVAVDALKAMGRDVYAVEPVDRLGLELSARDVEVRIDHALDHLSVLPEGALGGLLLSGCVDRLPRGSQLELARLAADRVTPEGWVVIVGTHPAQWEPTQPLLADLGAGRPLHGETWAFLLEQHGLVNVSHTAVGGQYLVSGQVPA